MVDGLRKITLLATIARRKGPRQLARVLSRKARNQVYPRLPLDLDRRYRRKVPADLQVDATAPAADSVRLREALGAEERARYRRLAGEFADGRVTFLGRSRLVPDPAAVAPTDDGIADLPRLWYLKLASMEPIRWAVLGHECAAEAPNVGNAANRWVQSVGDREPIATRVGYLRGFWAPYAVSRRVLTLCRYASWNGGLATPVERFLFKNILFLANNVEHDVGGNHLFENGAAMVVGGASMPGHGERFVETGLAVLEAATEEQLLDDGYHYERSPMYHLAVTERLLTSLSVLRESGRSVPGWLQTATERACGYVEYIRPPDDRIPLLNDAVFQEAEGLDTVSRYARELGLDAAVPATPGDSQLYWLGGNEFLQQCVNWPKVQAADASIYRA